ncbi:hypothetical protein GCM10010174_75490 [Kutzneria viridogrisea]|uniref:Uncharacterized protein n=2 Tax=Kutzneria TaxID=43356 RepID=W5W7C4_9PSEU|nr:hypothetical protein [Kutzneria albida]AHH96446.1 hypothetical protein KALB_3078 [Kutzneria albida DSM 43870]MBA8928336.1 hypothetical protein [Kutzneria viridogrisea]
MTTSEDHVALVADLVEAVRIRVLDPLSILLGPAASVDALAERLSYEAEMWAAQLLDGTDAVAWQRLSTLLAALHPADEFDPPVRWWQTPLGRLVARRFGYPGREHVSFPVAGAMLGVTRQGVFDLVNRGKLTRHAGGGVSTDSVRDRLRGTR